MPDFTSQFNQLEEMYAPEELNSELADYITSGPLGDMIHHPLIIEIMYNPISNKMLNRRFSAKKQMLYEYISEEKWSAYIFNHERPYRLDALEEVIYEYTEGDASNWKLINSVWTDSENIYQNFERWLDIWTSSIPNRYKMVMDTEERYALRDLPDRIPIFRGCSHMESVTGLSWSFDRNKAVWFAKRFAMNEMPPILASGFAHKKDVLALFLARGESEIVIDPTNVMDITTEVL